MVGPTELLQCLPERAYASLRLLIFGQVHEHANATQSLWLLRANGKRPRRSCTTQNTQKFSPLHVHPKAQKAASYRLKGVL